MPELDDASIEPDSDRAASTSDVTGPDASSSEPALAFSPRAILGGFALLAALIVLLFRRRGGK